jgi:hypothetical protein
VLLLVTSITRWEILLFGAEIDGGPRKRSDPTNMFKIRDSFSITEGTGGFDLLDRIGEFKEPTRALKKLGAKIRAQPVADDGYI